MIRRIGSAILAAATLASMGGCALNERTPLEDPNLVKRSEAYATYMTVYQGCAKDFRTVYRGTIYVADLPADTRAELSDPHQPDGLPHIADEFGGMVATLPAHPDQAIMLAPYSGACEAAATMRGPR